jgi:hypothetical protein
MESYFPQECTPIFFVRGLGKGLILIFFRKKYTQKWLSIGLGPCSGFSYF